MLLDQRLQQTDVVNYWTDESSKDFNLTFNCTKKKEKVSLVNVLYLFNAECGPQASGPEHLEAFLCASAFAWVAKI